MWWRKKRNAYYFVFLILILAILFVILSKYNVVKEAKAVLLPPSSLILNRKVWMANRKNRSSKCYRVDLEKLNSIYLSVKTSKNFHQKRLAPLLVTWMQALNPDQVHVVTDSAKLTEGDKWLHLSKAMGFTVHHADCPVGHDSASLCCKSGVDFDNYYRTIEAGQKYGWFCHFDDDLYVNVPRLVSTLQKYNPFKEHRYIGQFPYCPDAKSINTYKNVLPAILKPFNETFLYAGGPVYCLSAKLMKEVERHLRGKEFPNLCKRLQIGPEDQLVGTVVQIFLGYNFTIEPEFHFQGIMDIPSSTYKEKITINLDGYDVPNATFTNATDPSRYLSFHCSLYPELDWCNANIHSIDDVIKLISKSPNRLYDDICHDNNMLF